MPVQDSLETISQGEHRRAENIARNAARHPVETLEFFGLKPDMTVVEVLPAMGWYTEIIAPYLAEQGRFYAAHFSPDGKMPYMARALEYFEKRVSRRPDIFGRMTVRHINPPDEMTIAPPGTADLVVTFRNVHNWVMAEDESDYFAAFARALKPGGVLGIVDHRAPADASMEFMRRSGYVTEAYVKELALNAGFELGASSELNANSLDTADYAKGVWALAPSFAFGDEDREKYTAIGESDRMTLKFVKPLE